MCKCVLIFQCISFDQKATHMTVQTDRLFSIRLLKKSCYPDRDRVFHFMTYQAFCKTREKKKILFFFFLICVCVHIHFCTDTSNFNYNYLPILV